MEFVGVDSCLDNNRPAMFKSELYKHWPPFLVARDVASFLGFMNFYGKFIQYFEHRTAPLRDIAELEMTAYIFELLTPAHAAAQKDLIGALTSDLCLARHYPEKCPYLLIDYSKFGFGYEIAQPSDDPASLAAMQRDNLGGDCKLLLPRSILQLRLAGFGSRQYRGKENTLHSHLGEAFALDWAIQKNSACLLPSLTRKM